MLEQQIATETTRRKLPLIVSRPRSRADCIDGPRPCPWVSCRYHLHLDLVSRGRQDELLENPSFEWGGESCALDVAERGPLTSREIAPLIGMSQSGCKELYRDSREFAAEIAKILSEEP